MFMFYILVVVGGRNSKTVFRDVLAINLKTGKTKSVELNQPIFRYFDDVLISQEFLLIFNNCFKHCQSISL